MNDNFKDILEALERKFRRGEILNGPALLDDPLGGDLSIAGYQDRVGGRPAAVLIPLTRGEGGLNIFFTERPETMKEHPGQISFPGGSKARRDKTEVETALREAKEEIGLPPDLVKVVGELTPYRTITHYFITPVLGLVERDFIPVLDEREVASAFEAPLGFFLAQANARRETRLHEGRERAYYAFDFRGHYIWGATAAMLVNLREALLAFSKD